MRKTLQLCTIAGLIALCLSLFLVISNGAAEDSSPNTAMPVAMRGAAVEFSVHPEMTTEKANKDYLVPVAGDDKKPVEGDKKPCPPGSPCTTRSYNGQTAVNQVQCTGGYACMHSGVQLCNNNTGTCYTVDMGGGTCACACVPN
jgi:hypothetical protein